MMTPMDIKSSMISLLKQRFPSIEPYGNIVKEGFDKPSFFIELISGTLNYESTNYRTVEYTIKITYFQKEKDEMDHLKMISALYDAIGMCIYVKERCILTENLSYEWIGINKDILQISFDISYYEKIKKVKGKVATEFFYHSRLED